MRDASASDKAKEKVDKEEKMKEEKKRKQPKACFVRGLAIADYLGRPKAAYRKAKGELKKGRCYMVGEATTIQRLWKPASSFSTGMCGCSFRHPQNLEEPLIS